MNLHLRQGIKSILRTPKICVLFFVFFLFLNVILGSSLVAIQMIQDFKTNCRDEYSTIGVFEYQNEVENSFEDYKKTRDELQCFFEKPHAYVRSWDITSQRLGYTPELNRRANGTYYEGYGVVVIKIQQFFDEEQKIQGATVLETLYDKQDHEEQRVFLSVPGQRLQEGHTYIVSGLFYKGKSGVDYFEVKEFSNRIAESQGFDGSLENMCLDITTEDGYEIPESADYFRKIAETYRVINDSITIQETNDLEALYPFHEKINVIKEGESFTQEEQGDIPKCVISDTLSERMGKKPGDTIELSVSQSRESVPAAAYWNGNGFDGQETYQVAGIYQGDDEYDYVMYVPKKTEFSAADTMGDGILGQVLIENGSEEIFQKEIGRMLPDTVGLKIYDQGYHAVVAPLNEILYMARILCTLAVMIGIALVLLFGYIYVYRQQRTGQIIWSLGAGKSAVYTYFLSGAAVIALGAGLMGGILTALLNQKTGTLIYDMAQSAGGIDYRYSNGNLSVQKAMGFAGEESIWPILLSAVGIILAVAVCICFFVALSQKRKRRRKWFRPKEKSRVSQSLAGGAGKYALISLRRRKGRNVLLLLTVTLSAFFLFQLSASRDSYKKQLEDFQKNSKVTGKFIDYRGKNDTKLAISGISINEMMRSGYIENMWVSISLKYEYAEMDREGGSLAIDVPENPYVLESTANRMKKGPDLIFTNDITHTVGLSERLWKNITYAQGYDETIFEKIYEYGVPCIIPESLMQEHGIQLGDQIGMYVLQGAGYISGFIMDVAGSYPDEGISKPPIYTSLYCVYGSEYLFDTENEPDESLEAVTAGSVSFELKDSSRITEFKDYLTEKKYSSVNNLGERREFILINDMEYLNTQQNMTQKMRYMNVFLPIIQVLLEIIILVVSFMMIRNRREEILLMRKLGTSKGRIFSSIFIEQFLIGLAGCVLGSLMWCMVFRSMDQTGTILSAVLLLLWTVGMILPMGEILRKSLLDVMQEGE